MTSRTSEKISSHDARKMIMIQFVRVTVFSRDDALCCVKATFPCWPSRLFGVARCCALLLEDGPRRPRTQQTLRCQCCALLRGASGPGEATRVADTGVRGLELGDVGVQTVAGPTSVLEATAIASSAAASVTNQSPGWANTSNLAPVPVFLEESGTSARQKCRASTEAIAPIKLSFTLASASAVSCGHRSDLPGHVRNDQPTSPFPKPKRRPAREEAWFTLLVHSTTFFPQGVQMNTDVHFLGTSSLATATPTRSRRNSVPVYGATCTLSART